ncbi:prolipoprotein diacylglyceryl transferase [Patescibacteria group bacterium]|nr:prolipoprotein diacylglyceryl transferase [Patescibacteria group bacterium]
MNDILLSVEGVSVYTFSAFVFLAFLWSSFVFYKKAIEYHENEETVFNAVLLMGALSFIFSRFWFVMTKLDWFVGHWIRVLFMKEYPGMNGWGVFLGVLLGVLVIVKKNKQKLFDWLDLVSLGLSAGIPIVYVASGVLSTEMMSTEIVKGLLLALWFFFLWWVEGEYRTFGWYRFRKTQAKTGFVTGGFVFGLGLVNAYAVLVAVGVLIVYIRSERKVIKDLKLLEKSLKGLKWPKIIKIK